MHAICITCGTQFAETPDWPRVCPICQDDRQYVGLSGQQWTTLDQLRQEYSTRTQEEESGLWSFAIEPKFGIGQRALLVQTAEGNVLWDCLSLFDEAAIRQMESLGGVQAIAISHPHYYTSMVEWSHRFGGVPVYLHVHDAEWVMRPDDSLRFWAGAWQALPGGLRLVRCGGHFPGACVLHWPQGSAGRGVLLSADTIQVTPDLKSVSFMYSYPNYIPLPADEVKRIAHIVSDLPFDRVYGAFPQMTLKERAKAIVMHSAERYQRALAGGLHSA